MKKFLTLLLAAAVLVPSCSTKKEEPVKPEKKTMRELLNANVNFGLTPRKIGDVPPQGDCYVAQGAASDGTYVYFVLRNSGDTKAVILKYTLDPFKLVATSESFNGGHCNDLTYYDKDNYVVLAHGQSQGKILTMIDASTLKVVKDVNISVGSGAISYDKTLDRYAISQGGSSLHVALSNFSVQNSYTRTDDTGYTAQGMGSDDSYVYFPMSGSTDNVIVVYDWKGHYKRQIKLPVALESESMFSIGDRYFVCFYVGGSQKGASLYEIFPVEKK